MRNEGLGHIATTGETYRTRVKEIQCEKLFKSFITAWEQIWLGNETCREAYSPVLFSQAFEDDNHNRNLKKKQQQITRI